MSGVVKFDPTKIMEGVREKIRAEFASLVPDYAWGQMVKAEVDAWMGKEFRSFVLGLVHEEVKRIVGLYFSDEEWRGQWDYKAGGAIAGEAVKKILVENMGQIIQSFVGGITQSVIDNMRLQMGR